MWLSVRSILLLFAALAVLLSPRDACARQPADHPTVLILHSYHPLVHYTRLQDTAIREALVNDPLFPHLRIEYMVDTGGPDPESGVHLRDHLHQKYQKQNISLVITTDTPATMFWFQHGQDALPGVPHVFSAFRYDYRQHIPTGRETTGLIEELDVKGTLEIIRRLHPNAPALGIIVTDRRENDRFKLLTEQALAELPPWPRVEWLIERSAEDALARCRALPPGSVLLSFGFVDHGKRNRGTDEFTKFLQSSPDAPPVYGLYDSHIKSDYVGGMVVSASKQGEAAAQLALRILRGERASSIPVTVGPNAALFNEIQLRRFNIRRDLLPAGSEIVNLIPHWWQTYRTELFNGALLLTGAFVSAVVITAARSRQRAAELALAARDREAAQQIRNLLHSSADLLTAESEFDAAERVARAVRNAGWGAVNVYLYDAQWNMTYLASAGVSAEDLELVRLRGFTPPARAAFFTGGADQYRVSRSYYIPAPHAEAIGVALAARANPRPRQSAESWDPHDAAIVPLLDRHERVIGCISLADPAGGRRPDVQAFQRLEFFADLAARSIELLALVRQVRAAEAAALKAQQMLSQLLADARPLHEARDEPAVLQLVADAIHRSGWDSVTVFTYTDDWNIDRAAYAGLTGNMIEYLRAHSLTPERRREMYGPGMSRFQLSRSFFIPAEQISELAVPFDILPGKRAPRAGDTWKPRDLAYVPLRSAGGAVLGRFTLNDPADGQRPTREQLVRIEFFADLAARAIENLRLLERVRAAAEETRRSAEMLRTVVTNSPLVLWAADTDGKFTLSEGMGLRGFNLSPGQVVGTSVWEFVKDYPAVASQIRRALAGETYTDLVNIAGLTFETYFAPVLDNSGAIIGMTGVSTDITERRRVQAQLDESTARFAQFAESVEQVLWLEDVTPRRITFVNPAFERIWGIPVKELYDDFQVWGRSVHPEDFPTAKRVFEQWIAQAPGAEYDVEYRIIRRDGQVRWIHDRGVSIKNAEGQIARVAGVATDITARKKAALDLQRESELRRLLLSELDHRVKNALAGLLSMIDLSKDRRDEHAVAAIQARVQAMLTVHSMLSSSHWSSVNLMRLLSSMLPPTLSDRAAFNGPDVDIPARQATALGMVIQELMTNCQKHGAFSSAAGRLEVSWTISRPDPLDAHRLTIRWAERAGPRPASPVIDGTGTGLIHGFARFELRGEAQLSYPEDGATHTLIIGLDHDTQPMNPISNSDTSLTNELAALGSHI